MPSLVRERRGRRSWLSYTLVAVLVVLIAPTLVVLSFFKSLPESGIGEFKTVHKRGGGSGSADGGSARRLGRHLPAGWTKAGTDSSAARGRLIHKDKEEDAALSSNQHSSEGYSAAMHNERKASRLADAELDANRGGGGTSGSAHLSHAAGRAARSETGDGQSQHSKDGAALQEQDDKQLEQQQEASEGDSQQQQQPHLTAEARRDADPQQQLGSEGQQGEDRQGGQAEEQRAAAGQSKGSQLELEGSREGSSQEQQTAVDRGTEAQQERQQVGGQQGGGQQAAATPPRRRRGDEASGLPQPLSGQWPNLLPQARGALLPCPNCADKQPPLQCKQWSADGGCEKNPGFMYLNCAASCGICTVRYLHGAEVPQTAELVPGVLMPTVGYGTAGLGDLTADAVFTAIRVGYRLVDSAGAREWYREDLVGWGWSASGIKREHLFISSKVHPRHLGYWSTLDVFNEALQDLQTAYIDLMLLHYPECWGGLCGDAHVEGTWQDSWAALEQLVREGKLRAAGVSNFNLDQMAELVRIAAIKPALLQSNSDLLRQEHELQAFCRHHGIQFQAYSSLGGQWLVQTQGLNPVLDHPVVREIAQRLGRSEAQVALRWALQHGQAVVPRTSKVDRMETNLDLFSFDLTDDDMQRLDALDGSLQLGAAAR